MTLCLNCQKEVEPTEGKRAKKYCSGSCRASHYQKTHPKREKKYVLMKTHQKVLEELKELRSKVRFAGEADEAATAPNTYDSPKKQYTTEDESPKYVAPPKQEPPTQATVLSYQELLRLAPSVDTREKREEFWRLAGLNRKLNANQKEALRLKLPTNINP